MLYEKRIRTLRRLKRKTQQDIAEYLGISRGRYSQYETEIDIFPLKHLNRLSELFDTSLDYLLGFTDKIKYEKMKNTISQKDFGERLKNIRIKLDISQKKFAEELNCSPTMISLYETGKLLIKTPELCDICKKYKVSMDYMLGRIDIPLEIGTKDKNI